MEQKLRDAAETALRLAEALADLADEAATCSPKSDRLWLGRG